MKYFLFKAMLGTDGKTTKSVYEYGTDLSATAAFHKEYGKLLDDPNYTEVLVMCITEDGKVIERGCTKKS